MEMDKNTLVQQKGGVGGIRPEAFLLCAERDSRILIPSIHIHTQRHARAHPPSSSRIRGGREGERPEEGGDQGNDEHLVNKLGTEEGFMDCPVPLFVYRIRIAFCILPVREMRIGVNDDLE